ncbi:MAG: hypothetical protein WD934_05030 [Gemmatimonadales bacterium]
MLHLDDAVIAEYIDTAVISRDHERHLSACAECRVLVEDAVRVREQAKAILHRGLATADPPPFTGILARAGRTPVRRRSYRGLAWAATVALAAGLGWYGRALVLPAPTPVVTYIQVPVGESLIVMAEAPASEAPATPAAPAPSPVTMADLAGPTTSGAGAGTGTVGGIERLPAAPPPERAFALRQAEPEAAQRLGRLREEQDAISDWRAVSLEEAQTMLGGDLQTVAGLQTLGYAVRAVRGGVEVRTEQVLGGGAVLELLQRRLRDNLLAADAVRRGDFEVSGRAPIPRDSLRALLLRLQ